ncbi:MAG: type II secretion system protein J [Opitutales bacterium]
MAGRTPRSSSPATAKTGFMTIYIPPTDFDLPRTIRHRGERAFTLVEVMVAAGLSAMILTGVMTAFLYIGRAGFSTSAYSEMEAQVRRGLDNFANNARTASAIQWNSSQSITLTLPTSTNATSLVTYAYDAGPTGVTAQCFYRLPGSAASTAARQILISNVQPNFSFVRYKLDVGGGTDDPATNDLETKLIQVNLQVARTAVTAGPTSESARSARILLRNKRVTN